MCQNCASQLEWEISRQIYSVGPTNPYIMCHIALMVHSFCSRVWPLKHSRGLLCGNHWSVNDERTGISKPDPLKLSALYDRFGICMDFGMLRCPHFSQKCNHSSPYQNTKIEALEKMGDYNRSRRIQSRPIPDWWKLGSMKEQSTIYAGRLAAEDSWYPDITGAFRRIIAQRTKDPKRFSS